MGVVVVGGSRLGWGGEAGTSDPALCYVFISWLTERMPARPVESGRPRLIYEPQLPSQLLATASCTSDGPQREGGRERREGEREMEGEKERGRDRERERDGGGEGEREGERKGERRREGGRQRERDREEGREEGAEGTVTA